jgi:hypothetical protein
VINIRGTGAERQHARYLIEATLREMVRDEVISGPEVRFFSKTIYVARRVI